MGLILSEIEDAEHTKIHTYIHMFVVFCFKETFENILNLRHDLILTNKGSALFSEPVSSVSCIVFE